jgi:hypothetical protein
VKTTFDQPTRDELIGRIHSLNKDSKAQWGKMNVYQMTKHMTIWNEWVLGVNDYTYKQGFLGKIFGKIMLKKHTKDKKPLGKGMPAGEGFTVTEKEGNLELQKKAWIDLIEEYEDYSNPDFIHDFYGKMTEEQLGIFVYKHHDHHLRQFNS